MRIYLAVVIILLVGSCDENSNEDSAGTDNDYSLTISNIPETLDDGILSDLEVTLKRNDDTVERGALAGATIAMKISCATTEDKENKVLINKTVEAEEGVADFGDIKVSEGICKVGEYSCDIDVSLKINDKDIKDRAKFAIEIEELSDKCPPSKKDEDTEVQPPTVAVGAGKTFDITGRANDSVELRKKSGAGDDDHCQALLLQEEVDANGVVTKIKEQGIIIDNAGNAKKLFVVGTVDNCELYAGQKKINKQFTNTIENDGSSISIKTNPPEDTHVEVALGNYPNGTEDNPTVSLFISQGMSAVLPVSNPSWSKQWEKNTTPFSYGVTSPEDSSVEWQDNMTNAMAVLKVGDSWQTIGLIVPTATLQISGTMTAGSEFTVEGRDGGILSLANKGDSSCGASLYQLVVRDRLPHILKKGSDIRMNANNQASNLIIAGNTGNCQLKVGEEKVAGTVVAMQNKDGASIIPKSSDRGPITVVFGVDPMPTSTISEMFVQVGTTITDGMRYGKGEELQDNIRIFPWTTTADTRSETHIAWGTNSSARALFRASKGELLHKWYSIWLLEQISRFLLRAYFVKFL